jgi:hypothetical protein
MKHIVKMTIILSTIMTVPISSAGVLDPNCTGEGAKG